MINLQYMYEYMVLAAGIETLQYELVSFLGKCTCYFWTLVFLYSSSKPELNTCLKKLWVTPGFYGQGYSPQNTFNEDVFSGIVLHSGISSYHEGTQPIPMSLITFQCCGHEYFSRLAVNFSNFDFGAAFLLFVLAHIKDWCRRASGRCE